MKQSYTVTEDADMLAPDWLTARINYTTIKFIYHFIYGTAKLKGVRIGNEIAKVGDVVVFDGKRLSVESRNQFISYQQGTTQKQRSGKY